MVNQTAQRKIATIADTPDRFDGEIFRRLKDGILIEIPAFLKVIEGGSPPSDLVPSFGESLAKLQSPHLSNIAADGKLFTDLYDPNLHPFVLPAVTSRNIILPLNRRTHL